MSGNVRPLVAALLAITILQADPRSDADLAFERGDYPAALELYEQQIGSVPGDAHALRRAALLLSWDNRLAEALALYDRALTLDAEDQEATLGRARVLAWSSRTTEAEAVYRKVLERHPGQRDARLGLARALAWAGQYGEARTEYQALLAADPADAAALAGIAQTYAWSGELAQARTWYERALGDDPQSLDANVGLAYVDLWAGRPAAADARATALGRQHPQDRAVAQLTDSVRRARAPRAWAASERVDDTDDNTLETHRLGGGLHFDRGVGLRVELARYAMNDAGLEARFDALTATAELQPARDFALVVRAGADRRTRTDDSSETEAIGGVDLTWGVERRWQVSASAARDPLRYSPEIADNDVVLDEYAVAVRGRIGGRWRVEAGAGGASVSDGNDRTNALVAATYTWPVRSLVLDTGYLGRWMDYGEDLAHGYFDPANFVAHAVRLRAASRRGARRLTWDAGIDVGVQSFDTATAEVANDELLVATGSVGVPLGGQFTLELYGGYSDYAAQNPSGFESEQLGLRLRWLAGH